MNFSSVAPANFEGLLEVSRKICRMRMAEKALSDKAKIPLGFLVSLCETATSQIEDLRRGTAAAELISGSQGKSGKQMGKRDWK